MHKLETPKMDTLNINNQLFIKISEGDSFKSLITLMGDTVVPREEYYMQPIVIDINNDGWQDVRIYEITNTPGFCQNYFYDPTTKTLRNVLLDESTDIENIKGTNLYFSYLRAGCADNNWESTLIKIENRVGTVIGRMMTEGCGEQHDGIYISKVNGDKETKIEKSPIVFGNEKWFFLEKYWKKNYRRFDSGK